jgi:two-component system, NarL family, nitrate/nitrite response regulator NarL
MFRVSRTPGRIQRTIKSMHVLLLAPAGLVRDGIARIVRELGSSVHVRCIDTPESIRDPHAVPRLVVVDGDSHPDPTEAVQAVREQMPAVPAVVLLTSVVRSAVDRLLGVGISGCVEKSATASVFLGALRLALAGGTYLPLSVLSTRTGISRPPITAPPPAGEASDGGSPHLTPRQVEVLALAARGESNKAIARQLAISEGTVKIHLTAVYKALKVRGRGQATNVAMRRQNVVDEQVKHALGANTAIARLLPHMALRQVRAKTVVFSKGDATDALYYIMRGTLRLVEIGEDVGAGSLLGEVGLFTTERRHTLTARCATDLDLLWMSASDAMRQCYQDPEFAVYVLQLITQRLVGSPSR